MNFYGKSFNKALEKGLLGKLPSLLLKMGKCHLKLGTMEKDISTQMASARLASYKMGESIVTSLRNNEKSSQGEKWIWKAIKEAKSVEAFFFDDILSQVQDKAEALRMSALFANELVNVNLPKHPYLNVLVSVHKQVAFQAFGLTEEFLRMRDHQGARQSLQILLTALSKAEYNFTLQENDDAEVKTDLETLSKDYRASCDTALALEAWEAGSLIADFAAKEMESKDIESALNRGWDALDKFKETETLTEASFDEVCYDAKSAQGFLYLNIFKNHSMAKKIFTAIIESSASESHKDKEWFQNATNALKKMEKNEPSAQKASILEELKPDLDKIKVALKDAGRDLQKIIDFIYTNYPPIPRNDGNPRVKPSVINLTEAKAKRKMIFSYHPDKIDSSDMKHKLLCEEITKIFTLRAV